MIIGNRNLEKINIRSCKTDTAIIRNRTLKKNKAGIIKHCNIKKDMEQK